MDFENLDHLRRDVSPRDLFTSARSMIRGWTWTGSYLEACALVTGYLAGRGKDLTADFELWLHDRYGGARKLASCGRVLRLALPEIESPDPAVLSASEDAAAVDKLFELLLEWLDDTEQSI